MANTSVVLLLLQSVSRNVHPTTRYATLATVDQTGRARARMIVIRKVEEQPLRLVFCTDRASHKLHESRLAELCWYLGETREQYRLAGEVEYTEASAQSSDALQQREQLWQTLSPAMRSQYTGPATNDIPDSFVLGALTPDHVDYVSLFYPPSHFESSLQPDGSWSPLVPCAGLLPPPDPRDHASL